jgi:hypothetical protein
MRLSGRFGSRSVLRLSGKGPDPAPEQKSEEMKAANVFRRFFHVLTRLDRRGRADAEAADNRRNS